MTKIFSRCTLCGQFDTYESDSSFRLCVTCHNLRINNEDLMDWVDKVIEYKLDKFYKSLKDEQ